MTSSMPTASQQINYPFLLLTHIVCADQQIHSEESKSLRELADIARVGQQTQDEMEKILAQDDDYLRVEDIACRVLPGQQNEAMRQILAIAYSDGFFAPLEREVVFHIAQVWNWSTGEIEQIIEEAQGFTTKRSSSDVDEQPNLSIAARLLKNEKQSAVSRGLINLVKKAVPDTVGRKIEQLEREILLSGSEYNEAIEQCAKIASEDYKYAEVALKEALSALCDLGKNIQLAVEEINSKARGKGQATTAKEVAKQLETTRNDLTTEVVKKIESVRESLHAKQRALNHFSIAFMGKTKAGKSTLHAIVTQDGWEAIGVGKQRTTRYNRVYEWKNIRIIDTPGIGAPGGRTDEEIAESVIEESDVICYVVTNDSIQETEFKFMKLLKEKAKPLIILLNVKYNLRDSRRLEYFLKDPKKLFAMEGNSGLRGHIERIRRYAQEHYANDYFDIIPVMLLAAQLSREPEHQEYKDKLFKASRVQYFLDSVRESLIKHGAIRRSQTLLGSTVGAIEHPDKWVTQQTQVYQQQTATLKNKQEIIQNKIQLVSKDSQESLLQQIEGVFQEAVNAISSFAEDHWNSNEAGLKHGWEQKLKAIKFEERLRNIYQDASQKFNKEVQEAIEEVGKELQLMAQLEGSRFSFNQQDSDTFQRIALQLGGALIAVGGLFLPLFGVSAAIASVVGIVGGVASWLSQRFKSKEEKRREAVQNISNSLEDQLNQQKQNTLQQAESNFGNSCSSVAMSVHTYFEELIQSSEAIATYLETAKKRLDGTTNYLNRAYAKRIIDWSVEQYEPLSDEGINKTIAKVQRDFGRSITIQTKSEILPKKSQEDIKQVLQEDVFIQGNNY